MTASEEMGTVETILDARTLYETAAVEGLWMADADCGIRLFQGSVVENDGAGAGRSDDEGREPFEEVSGGREIRKSLDLDRVPDQGVVLSFLGKERKGHQACLRFLVNGREFLRRPSPQETPEARQYWEMASDEGAWNWSRWYYMDIPASALNAGKNEITIRSADGQLGWSLMVADYRDFGKGAVEPGPLPESSSCRSDPKGAWGPERGEYVIRLHEKGYRGTGCLTSDVVDIAGEGDRPVKSRREVEDLRLTWEADTPAETGVGLKVRTGSSPRPDTGTWTDWRDVVQGESAGSPGGRYLQFEVTLSSRSPAVSPVFKGVRTEAQVQPTVSKMAGLRVVSADNARILRPSRPYLHEDYRCEILQELRDRFELDAVVAGAQTEFEVIERLMRWAYFVPLGECWHFPWDILDWLVYERDAQGAIRMNQYEDRRRDKMCLYPNVVLVAACLSMGIPARHLNFHSEGMTGHEIAEAWSNDYGKWVHLDATRDYYWYDPATRVPLDTLEIHEALADRLEQVERWDRPYLFQQDLDELVRDLPIAFREGCHPVSVAEGAFYLFRSFCHFRIIPRGNTFTQPAPMPVSQGTEVWAWDGYLNWADDRVPPLLHFNHHTNRRADFYPTLNQVRLTLTQAEKSGTLEVDLDTETPNFSGFIMRLDEGAWAETPAFFEWALHEGLNVLRVRSVNSRGREGIVSSTCVSA